MKITHPEKWLWPSASLRKIDYLHYLTAVSPYLLPHLRDRPATLIRYPHGQEGPSFYQKNIPPGAPDWIAVHVDRSGKNPIRYPLINDLDTLLWVGNLNALELHPWYSLFERPQEPTQLVFDLDPSAPGFELVRTVSFALRDALTRLNLPAYPKTSGMTGLQVYVPIARGYTFEDTRAVTAFIAHFMAHALPTQVTLERRIANRGAKVYLDYVQHAPHKTLIAPYSARASSSATVSAPITWEELEQGALPGDFTIRTMPKRLARTGDLFAPLQSPGPSLQPILEFIETRRLTLQ